MISCPWTKRQLVIQWTSVSFGSNFNVDLKAILNSGEDISNKTEIIATSLNLRAVFYLLLKTNVKVDTRHWSCEKVHPFSRWFFSIW